MKRYERMTDAGKAGGGRDKTAGVGDGTTPVRHSAGVSQ